MTIFPVLAAFAAAIAATPSPAPTGASASVPPSIPIGDAIRGKAARAYVLVSAADGYAAILSLGELDAAGSRCAPLAASEADGAPLPGREGPVQIVAPCDGSHARRVRAVTKLTIVIADL